MTNDNSQQNDIVFVSPSAFSISPDVVDLARHFIVAAGDQCPPSCVVALDWAISRKERLPGTNDWCDLGPGLDMCLFSSQDIPAENIVEIDGLKFCMSIPREKIRPRSVIVVEITSKGRKSLVFR